MCSDISRDLDQMPIDIYAPLVLLLLVCLCSAICYRVRRFERSTAELALVHDLHSQTPSHIA